jgi:hypothetical protein
VLTVPGINPGGGTVSNYYQDNSAVDPTDTGDQLSFGDAGLRIDNPGLLIQLRLVTYILPPGTTTNVGAAYFSQVNNPLIATATIQRFGFNFDTFLPIILKN